jgi:quercetin dioxygenase-like cupin family protein
MPLSGTGERVTPVLDFPSRDGLSVQAIRVDYEPGGFTRGAHRHPAGAYEYVIDGSVKFVVGDVLASLIAFFAVGEGESATVDHV